jgi:hypothetical protein
VYADNPALLASLKELLLEAAIIYEDDPEVPIEQLPEKLNELKEQLPEMRAAKRMVARMRMENSEQLTTIEEQKGRQSEIPIYDQSKLNPSKMNWKDYVKCRVTMKHK